MNTYSMTQSTSQTASPRPRRTSTLATLTFAGLALTLAGPAAAQLACKHVDLVPNKTLTLGVGVHSVTSTSNGGGYATTCCKYYVVDIFVPSNSSGPSPDLKSFRITTSPTPGSVGIANTQPECTNITGRTYVYIKPSAGNSFEEIAHWEVEGVWKSEDLFPCSVKFKPNSVPLSNWLNPPASGTDIYRVVTVEKLGASSVAVTVSAAHNQP